MTLQAKLDAFKADFRAGKPPYNAPPEIHPIMERATAELIASGATSRALVTATRFLPPNFWRTDLWSLASTAVCGVRTATSSCRPLKLRFRRYARRAPTSLRSRRRLRRTAGSRSARTSSAFPYSATPETTSPPLSDCGSKLPDYLIDLYKQLKNDLPAFNGDDSWTLPIPGRFVIGQDGMIRYADVNPDYTRRLEPDELLPALLGSAVAAA